MAASHLYNHFKENQTAICNRVTKRLATTFPELKQILKMEGSVSFEERLNDVAVERFAKLVQAMLLFETMSLADQEMRWAAGVLPRYGVTYEQQTAMVRWFFEEIYQGALSTEEMQLAREMEQYLQALVTEAYQKG